MCGRRVPRHASYILRIEVVTNPSTPAMDTDTNPDPATEIDSLLDQMKHYSADELQDQVYRKFELHLCSQCHPHYLANPLGLPRKDSPGHN